MFKIFYLSKCGYSQNALKTLRSNNLVNDKNEINCDNRDDFFKDPDSKYILNDYSTYPKILFIGFKKPIFIGGNSELTKLIEIVSKPLDDEQKIPSQKYINRKLTCKILLKLLKRKN